MLEQTPAQKRGASLKKLFERAFALRRDAIAALGDNLRVWVPNVASWTLVTKGPMTGVHDDPAKELPAGFALTCDDAIVLEVITGTLSDAAIAKALAEKRITFDGDVELFVKFAGLLP